MGRTKKNIQLGVPENPSKIKGSRAGGYRIATVISSPGRCQATSVFSTSMIWLYSMWAA